MIKAQNPIGYIYRERFFMPEGNVMELGDLSEATNDDVEVIYENPLYRRINIFMNVEISQRVSNEIKRKLGF